MNDNHDLYLSRPEIQQLATRLRELADWICTDLDDTICRLTAFGNRNDRPSNETPLVFNETAAEVAHDVYGTLRTWVEHTVTHSTRPWPGEHRAPTYARWLNTHIIDLAKTEEAETAADEITDTWKRAKKAIDRPEPQQFVGPCQSTGGLKCEGVYCKRGATTKTCGTCELVIDIPTVQAATQETMQDRLFAKPELREAMLMYGAPVTRQRLDNWIRRGRLIEHGGRYKLADALALVADIKKAS